MIFTVLDRKDSIDNNDIFIFSRLKQKYREKNFQSGGKIFPIFIKNF
jgi:hypothetical protein